MKLHTIKIITVILFLALFHPLINAQEDETCTTIEVCDGHYVDKVWLFSINGTTNGWDNGWDGFKFLNTSAKTPQIFLKSVDGNFQVSSTTNIHNSIIGFMAGNETEYTLLFKHTNISKKYNELYLIDLIANKTINIFSQESQYAFKASKSDITERFVLVTFLDKDNVEPANKSLESSLNQSNNVKVICSHKKIIIDNPNSEKGILRLINAQSGKMILQEDIAAETITTLESNTKTGVYIAQIIMNTTSSSSRVLIE